jgi:hypothetical protein
MKIEDIDLTKRIEIAEHYNGTCKSVEDYDDIPDDIVLEVLVEQEVDVCVQCGWWSDIAEMDDTTGELICAECAEGDAPDGDE